MPPHTASTCKLALTGLLPGGLRRRRLGSPGGLVSAGKLVLIIAATVFSVELGIMLLLPFLGHIRPVIEAILDAGLLTALCSMILYWALFRPLERILAGRTAQLNEQTDLAQRMLANLSAYRAALDEHAIIVITDPWGTITEVNEPFCRISKFSREELIGKTHRILNSGIHSKEFWGQMWRTISSGSVWRGEVCNRAKDGSLHWLDSTIAPIRDASGQIVRYLAIRLDVTENVRMAQARRESEKRYEALATQSPVGLFRTNSHGQWEYVNNRWCEISGLTPEEAIGFGWARTLHLEDRDTVLGEWLRVVRKRGNYKRERRLLRPDGVVRWVLVQAAPHLGEDGQLLGYIGTITDMTEHKRTEELERQHAVLSESVESMERVLGVVAHELRTPLAGLRAASEYLLTDGARETEDYNLMLRNIHQGVIRMTETVNELLEAARLNSGVARWNWSRFAVADVCSEALETARSLVDPTAVRLFSRVEPADLSLCGDSAAVRRLMLNLLSNSAKFTSSGQISVEMAEELGDEGRCVEICVRDSGCGITPHLADSLGEAFALNAGAVGTTFVEGTGLGLSICKAIATAHGGKMRIESTPGIGTAVTVRLRADLTEPAPAPAAGQATIEFVNIPQQQGAAA